MNELGERLYAVLFDDHPLLAPKLTGMMLELSEEEIRETIRNPETRCLTVERAVQTLLRSRHDGLNEDLAFPLEQYLRDGMLTHKETEDQKAFLGDKLFYLIRHLEGEKEDEGDEGGGVDDATISKITGVLLEMKSENVIKLLVGAEPLKENIREVKNLIGGSVDDIGDQLFELVSKMEPSRAEKITGMLLEMQPDDIRAAITSRAVLQQSVNKAVQILEQMK